MATGRLIFPGQMPAVDANGDAAGGAKAYIYQNQSTTLATTVYSDSALTAQHANPIEAGSTGAWPAMYADDGNSYTVAIVDADGAPLAGPWDGVTAASSAATAAVALAESAAAEAEAHAATALNSASTRATSTTSLTIGAGSHTFTIAEEGKAFSEGQTICLAYQTTPTTQMSGVVTAWDDDTREMTITVSAGSFAGSGTYASWHVFPTGVGAVQSVVGFSGVVLGPALKTAMAFVKADVGLGDVDNTSVLGKQAIWIPATAMLSRSTNGAALITSETTTNKVMRRSLDFDASTIEYAQFQLRMPKAWDESTVTFVPVWSHGATTVNFGVSWGLQGVALSNDDALDTAFGTAQYSNDTGGTTDDVYFGPESSAITIAGSPAAEDFVAFQVLRKADDGTNDTLAVDAKLLGITLYITNTAGSDD